MRTFNIVKAFIILFVIVFTTITFAQQSNNKAFVFDGESSRVFIEDGSAVNQEEAKQYAFQYFNKAGSDNDNITVQAWVYLIGENLGAKMSIIYRAVDGGSNSFSLYVDADRKAYFSIDNANSTEEHRVGTSEIPAFTWVQLTGIYDADNQELKIYYGKDLEESQQYVLSNPYTTGEGLYIGKFNENAFKGLIDEIRLWNIALGENNINGSGGNGNPAEPFPNSLAPYLAGQWSFNEIGNYGGTEILEDFSDSLNHLRVDNINEIVNSKHLPFFVVNSIEDDGDALPGDGKATSFNGDVTLRSAIEEANVLPGQQTIYFYITETNPIIQPLAELPTIIQPVILDGTSQSGYYDNPQVQVQVIDSYVGLTISGGGSTLQGLAISNSSNYGLTLSDAGDNTIEANQISGILISSSDNNITDNIITNLTGDGISITAGAEDNQIGGDTEALKNIISNNDGHGISLDAADNNTFSRNEIFGNSGYGISIANSTGNQLTNNTVGTNEFGGTANTLGGISITNSTANLTGNKVNGNSVFGISLEASDGNTLSGNNVSGTTGIGISITGGTGNQLTNNTVGPSDVNETANTLGGISITNSTAILTGNIITGNDNFGILLNTQGPNYRKCNLFPQCHMLL